MGKIILLAKKVFFVKKGRDCFIGVETILNNTQLQVGSDTGMALKTDFADIELTDLGIGSLRISDMDSTEDALAPLSIAIDRISTK